MSSFYHSITGYFDKGKHGRFLAILLLELARHEPQSFAALIEAHRAPQRSKRAGFWRRKASIIKAGECSIEREYPFMGLKGERRADLALVTGKHVDIAFEVKEFDGAHSKHNTSQLEDYLRMVKPDRGFVYVYRFLPDDRTRRRLEAEQEKDRPVALLSYDRIHSTLSRLDQMKAPLARLLCSYMEDIGVGIYTKLNLRGDDKSAAIFLLSQILGMPHASGFKKNQSDQSVRRGADIIKLMYSNTEVLMEWMRHSNTKIMPKKSTRRLWINPVFDIKKLRGDLNVMPKASKPRQLPKKMWPYVMGGDVYFESSCGIRSPASISRRLSLKIGISLSLRKEGKHVKAQFYAYFEPAARSEGDDIEPVESVITFPTEETAQRIVLRLVEKLIEAARTSEQPIFRYLSDFELPITP
ncbi:hypothetical protein AB7813_14735 [Tardiphaga sp. 20_F10_N6_6]|uniref:hypothetical protein n=1 Tax=Tardiphaga sp. 20_F10_N6_6 TaxID=3240788 RepID=UPI003F88B248